MKYTELRNQKRINLAEQIPLDYPLSIYIEPTNLCNFKCVFCPESFVEYREISGGWHRLSRVDFDHIANEISALTNGKGVKTINFYMMGEPFLNRDLLDFVGSAKQRSLAGKIIVTSNGSMIGAEKHDEIISTGLDFLRISIYGSNEKQHKRNSQSSVSLDKIHSNLLALRRRRTELSAVNPFIYIKMIDQLDIDSNHDFIRMFTGVGDEVALEPRMDWDSPQNTSLSGLNRDDLLSHEYFSNKKDVCPFPFYTLVIHSDLKVSVCCVDWSKALVVGDLKNSTLRDIWHGPKLLAIQEAHIQRRRSQLPSCRNCTYLHTSPDNIDELTIDGFRSRFAGPM